MGLDLEELSKILCITTENWKLNKDDDYFTFQFIGGLMDLLEIREEQAGCLTDNGRNILLYSNLNGALKAGNDTKEKKREVFKATLYLFTAYTLCVLFIGFYSTKGKTNKDMWDKIPTDYKGVIVEVYDKIVPKMSVYKGLLEHLLNSLDEDMAMLFSSQKRAVFERDIFAGATQIVGDATGSEMDMIKKSAVEMKA